MTAPNRWAPAKALSVDVDGTLYRVQSIRVAWRLRRYRGLLFALMAARKKIRYEVPLENAEALRTREAELVAPSLGLSMRQARYQLYDLRSRLPAALTTDMEPYPGVRSALEAAAARGLVLASLSDFDPLPKLEQLGLDDLPWRLHLGADSVGGFKPQARPFLTVCEQLGVLPGEVVHVGDREDQDILGAVGAGLRAWRFSRYIPVRSAAERVFSAWTLDLFTPLIATIDESS